MIKECFKPIIGYEVLYEISNMGRVKALKRVWFSGKNCKTKRESEEKIIKQANSTSRPEINDLINTYNKEYYSNGGTNYLLRRMWHL